MEPEPIVAPTIVSNLHKDLTAIVLVRFNSTHSKLRAFLVQVELYLGFNSIKFSLETEQVLWAITLLEGLVLTQAEPFVTNYIKNQNAQGAITTRAEQATINFFLSQKGFKKAINTVYRDINKERTAVYTLQNLKQKGVAATYIMEFQQYSGQTDWNDDTLKDQYYRGLKDTIKDEIVRSDRLDILYEMIALTIKIDNHYYER